MNNQILSRINKKIRNGRKRNESLDVFYPRIEEVVGGYYLELWFTTEGCSFDKNGSCTMCNYGVGNKVDNEIIIKKLEDYLDKLKLDITELMISPSGSLWDKNEVNEELLHDIYNLVNNCNINLFMIETRIDTINQLKLQKIRATIPNKKLIIEIGLESSNNWVLKYLINKKLKIDTFKSKIDLIKSNNIGIYTNISLGNAFLTEKEAIKDTIESIRFAFNSDIDKVVIFPIHIKPNTFIEWLHQNNFYQTISLWSLIEVLNSVEKELLQKIEIAWYKSYYEDDSKMLSSPTTCPKCRDKVIDLLDEYRSTCSFKSIEQLNAIKCECKNEWEKRLEQSPEPLLERTVNIYKKASKDILNRDLDIDFINIMRVEYVDNFR